MYKKFIAILMIFLTFNSASAGELKGAGTILTQDSYVFSIEEAEKLKIYIEELEQKNEKYEEEIKEYEKLDSIFLDKEKVYQDIIETKNQEIFEYQELHALDTKKIDKLERHEKFAKYERFGFFVLGIVVASGSIIIADNIDDSIENN